MMQTDNYAFYSERSISEVRAHADAVNAALHEARGELDFEWDMKRLHASEKARRKKADIVANVIAFGLVSLFIVLAALLGRSS